MSMLVIMLPIEGQCTFKLELLRHLVCSRS
jgi:hypothetical protein